MKKTLTCLLAAVLLCAAVVPAAAVPNGTVINHTRYTDIVASIDGHPLRSYNVDDHTVVVAEDLRAYGFDVIWHAEERWLEVLRPLVNGEWKTPATYPDYTPEVPAGRVGMPAHNILATDIVTTVGGDTVDSWNIGGETVIPFRDLARYGKVVYDNATRRSIFTTVPYAELTGDTGAAQSTGPKTPEEELATLRARLLFHETLFAENEVCYALAGYFSATTRGNTNDLYVVYKSGGTKNLNPPVSGLEAIDSLSFDTDPNILIVTIVSGKNLSADRNSLLPVIIKIDIRTGETVG